MIEAEEVFESTQETGYRLCSAPGATSDKLFASHWDSNNPDRLFVCTQDGGLNVIDTKSNVETNYRVLFRSYTTADTAGIQLTTNPHATSLLQDEYPDMSTMHHQEHMEVPSKVVSYHWDKILTIPDRPDELIFLLGITKSLYYTALPGSSGPYPEEPFLAQTTRYDFSDYIYGTPVMELWTHESRITSIAVSPFGHILSSGDEHGNVKLLVLQLLDELSITNKEKKKKQINVPTFKEFIPEYKISLCAHKGSIFSMQWLPIVCEGQDWSATRCYCLATGSTDKSVRLWRVTCSTKTGLSISPLMSLDTIATHILCLNTYLDYSLISERDPRVQDAYDTANVTRRKKGIYSFSLIESARRITTDMSIGGKHYREKSISDGVSSTTVDDDLIPFKTLIGQPVYMHTSGYALIPSALYLAAGTSLGAIYVWKIGYDDIVDMLGQVYDRNGRKNMIIDDGRRLHSLLQTSDRPIVHVALSAAVDVNAGDTQATTSSGKTVHVRDVLRKRSSRPNRIVLVASDTQGDVRTHCEIDVNTINDKKAKSFYLSRNEASTSSGNNVKGPITLCGQASHSSPVISCTFKEIDLVKCVQEVEKKLDIDDHTVDPNEILMASSSLFICLSNGTMQLTKSSGIASLSALRNDASYAQGSPTQSPLPASGAKEQLLHDLGGNRNTYRVDADMAFESIPTLTLPKASENESDVDRVRNKDIYDELPTTTTTTATTRSLVTGDKKGAVDVKKESQNVSTNSIVSGGSAARRDTKKSKEARNSDDVRNSNDDIPIPRVVTQLPKPAVPPPTPTSRSPKKNTEQVSSPSSILKPVRGKSDVDTADDDSVSSDDHRNAGPNALNASRVGFADNTPAVKNIAVKSVATPAVPLIPTSELYNPDINSSSHLYNKLKELQDKLQSDDISVTTINTTSTDRREAAKAVVNVRYNKKLYDNLVQIQEKDSKKVSFHTRPQISKGWSDRKEYASPKDDDLKVLMPPDPQVMLHAAANSTGLKTGVDNKTLFPTFQLDLAIDDVYGNIYNQWNVSKDTVRYVRNHINDLNCVNTLDVTKQ